MTAGTTHFSPKSIVNGKELGQMIEEEKRDFIAKWKAKHGGEVVIDNEESNKIFEGARFGDRFKTRDGSMAVFSYRDEVANVCIVQNYERFWAFTDFGQCITNDRGLDIVSRWEEEK